MLLFCIAIMQYIVTPLKIIKKINKKVVFIWLNIVPFCSRKSWAHCGDRKTSCHAAEGSLRETEDLRVQGGDAHHPLWKTAVQFAAVWAFREWGQAVWAPLWGWRVLWALGGSGWCLWPSSLHSERPGRSWHLCWPAMHRRVWQTPHQPLLLQKAHLWV